MVLLSMSGSFTQFAALCDSLAATAKKLEKRALMAEWLNMLSVEDAARGSLYLAGQVFSETDGRVLNLGGAILGRALAQLSGATDAAMGAAYRRHGDMGAAAQDLLATQPEKTPHLTLAAVEVSFSQIADAKGPAAKLALTLELLGAATPIEAKYLIKLALGDMRTGVKQSLVEEAIARAFAVDAAAVRRATMLMGSLPGVVRLAAAGKLEEARMVLFHPLGFMLASPVESVEEALGRFAQEVAAEHAGVSEALPPGESLTAYLHTPGNPRAALPEPAPPELALNEAQIEDKYDGIRAQLHCGDPEQPDRVALFSRSREDMTAAFPELVEAFAVLDQPLILDGEVLAWDVPNARALPFSACNGGLAARRSPTRCGRRRPWSSWLSTCSIAISSCCSSVRSPSAARCSRILPLSTARRSGQASAGKGSRPGRPACSPIPTLAKPPRPFQGWCSLRPPRSPTPSSSSRPIWTPAPAATKAS